jgi:thioredoxin reductase
MDYRRPGLPGVEERWGASVFHCPFCHGWEHRDEPLHQRSGLAGQLGAAIQEPGSLVDDAIAVDARYATSVPGLFAAGDACGVMASVPNAVASGSVAAAMIVGTLTGAVPAAALAPAA